MRHLTRTLVHADLERSPVGFDKLPGVHDLQLDGSDGAARLSCQVDTAELGGFLRRLTDYGVRDLVSQPPTLEELFLRHYEAGNGQPAREEARR
jgi:ABC-2 type transport system ATP-binding protein